MMTHNFWEFKLSNKPKIEDWGKKETNRKIEVLTDMFGFWSYHKCVRFRMTSTRKELQLKSDKLTNIHSPPFNFDFFLKY